LKKKNILLLVFLGLIASGFAIQYTVGVQIDSPIGIHIAQIGAIGVGIIVFPVLIRKAWFLSTNPEATPSERKKLVKKKKILLLVFAGLIASGFALLYTGLLYDDSFGGLVSYSLVIVFIGVVGIWFTIFYPVLRRRGLWHKY